MTKKKKKDDPISALGGQSLVGDKPIPAGARGAGHRPLKAPRTVSLLLRVDLSRAERDHCAAKGSAESQGQRAGAWDEGRLWLHTQLWFLPRVSFGVPFRRGVSSPIRWMVGDPLVDLALSRLLTRV